MTKLSARDTTLVCVIFIVLSCSSDKSSNPSPTGVAGASAGAPAAAASGAGANAAGSSTAGSGTSGRGAAGTPASLSGSSGAPGSAGSAASGTGGTAANGGSGGQSAGKAGSGGSKAGAGGSGGAKAGTGGHGGARAGTGGSGGAGGKTAAAGSGGSAPSNGGELSETIVVKSGETFDGKNKRYSAGSALGDGSQSEDQKPLFKLEDGATLVNVVLGSPAADGIHCHGDVTLRNIVWEDIGEDALTIKEPGTVTIDGGSASNGDDKVFQINAESTFKVSNFKASNAGKFIRQNGGTKFKVDVFIDNCDVSNMDESIFRTDSDVSTVEMTNTRYSKIGDELFMGVNPANIKTSNNTEY
jgi:hypothetical protein